MKPNNYHVNSLPFLSWASWILISPSIPVYLRFILLLSICSYDFRWASFLQTCSPEPPYVQYVPSVSSSSFWYSERYGGCLVNYNVLKLENNFQQIVNKYSLVIIRWSAGTSQPSICNWPAQTFFLWQHKTHLPKTRISAGRQHVLRGCLTPRKKTKF